MDYHNTKREMKNEKAKRPIIKKTIITSFIKFILFNIIFSLITVPLLIFYGPFNNLKKSLVGTAMSTTHYQFVAQLFLNEKDIQEVLSSSYAIDPTKKGEKIRKIDINNSKKDKIDFYNITGEGFFGKMLIISNPKSVKVGYTNRLKKIGETTSSIARRNNAIAAINGGGFFDYKWTGTGGIPLGFIISEGKIVFDDTNDLNKERDTIGITDEGMLIVGTHSMNDIQRYKINEAVSFGPPLIVNGKPTIKSGDGGWGIAPRTAIAQTSDGSIIFLVIDGRSVNSLGATLKDVQDILLKYDVVNAANLDGGSSTTLYFNKRVVNTPSDSLGERTVPSVFMVVPSEDEKK